MLGSLGLARIQTKAPAAGSGCHPSPESHYELLISQLPGSGASPLPSPQPASQVTPPLAPQSLSVSPRMDDEPPWVLCQMLLWVESSYWVQS